MKDLSCEQWRGLIAMGALGGLSSDEVTALEAHLEGCADCESLAQEMSSTVARRLSGTAPLRSARIFGSA